MTRACIDRPFKKPHYCHALHQKWKAKRTSRPFKCISLKADTYYTTEHRTNALLAAVLSQDKTKFQGCIRNARQRLVTPLITGQHNIHWMIMWSNNNMCTNLSGITSLGAINYPCLFLIMHDHTSCLPILGQKAENLQCGVIYIVTTLMVLFRGSVRCIMRMCDWDNQHARVRKDHP